MANTEVVAEQGFTGLRCHFATELSLGTPAAQVELTLVHSVAPATVDARSGGRIVASGTMNPPEATRDTVTLNGPQIGAGVVRPPQGETLLLQLCAKAAT